MNLVLAVNVIKRVLSSILHRLGYACIGLSKRIGATQINTVQPSSDDVASTKLLETREQGRSLYETAEGIKLWLSTESIIDDAIISSGVWERTSTDAIKELVRPGEVALDVGANIGYYTTLMSKLVGPEGHVHAFEPTRFFGSVLAQNISENRLDNVTLHDFGLSDSDCELSIHIDGSTASVHMDTEGRDTQMEVVHFLSLDQIVNSLNLERLDFIKIDVDGHEPKFLKGAEAVLHRFRPQILLEINHLDYLHAGVTAWDFYDYVRSLGMHIFNVDSRLEILSKNDFLKQCGNFGWQGRMDVAFSRNILLTYSRLEDWQTD